MYIFSFVSATILFLISVVMICLFVYNAFKQKYNKTDKIMAICGYYSIGLMLALFFIFSVGYNNSDVEVAISYSGAWFTFLTVPFLILMIIADYKIQSYIKGLTIEQRKTERLSLENRNFAIIIVMILFVINTLLYCFNFESFYYIISF